MADAEPKANTKRSVTIFGAGVAGLTAAHELVERGFEVEVIDPDIREHVHLYSLDRGIGGMARSQWACRHERVPAPKTEGARPVQLRHGTEFLVDDVVVFDSATRKPIDKLEAAEVFDRAAELIRNLVDVDGVPDVTRASALIIGLPARVATPRGSDGTDYREIHFKKELGRRLDRDRKGALDHVQFVLYPLRDLAVAGQEAPTDSWLLFYVPELEIFPAEHGFRFFPSFYRHVFDTLKRIPIQNPGDHERTHATVRENLLPSESIGMTRGGTAKGFQIPRRPITSLQEGWDYLQNILREIGYEGSDIRRFALRLLEYTTSCTARRASEYENTSWAHFVEQEKYSPVSRRHLEYGPQMAAALRGSASDARTQGTIFLQLHMDQLGVDAPPDCTLDGPTSSAWLHHWQDYLVSQGVEFRRGTLVDFVKDQKGGVLPKVVRTPAPERRSGNRKVGPGQWKWPEEVEVASKGHYFVLALSLPGAAEVATRFLKVVPPGVLREDNDFKRTIDFAGDLSPANMQLPAPKGPLQHLSGIQFYFDVPINFWRGHTLYLDSEWGLTSIGQPQFWSRPRNDFDGYRGILSVDIGTWDQPYEGKLAWDVDAETLATGTWAQIKDHHDDAFRERFGLGREMPEPIAYAIDANITFPPSGSNDKNEDKTPFLVNRVGAFPKRPGRLIDDQIDSGSERETSKEAAFFDVYLHRYVIVGAFTKTYTRLTSMEAANESARHGVNAILKDAKVRSEHCAIWDPEDHEFPDLQWFRDLDEKRKEEGRPHLLRTIEQLTDLDVLTRTL